MSSRFEATLSSILLEIFEPLVTVTSEFYSTLTVEFIIHDFYCLLGFWTMINELEFEIIYETLLLEKCLLNCVSY